MSRDNRLQKRINEAYAKGYAAGLEETAHLSEQFEGGAPGGTGSMIGGQGTIDFNDYTFILSLIGENNTYSALINYTIRQGSPGLLQLPSGVFINIEQGLSPFIIVNRTNPPTVQFNFDALGQFFGVPNPGGQPAGPRPPQRSMRPGTNFARPTRQAPRPGIQQAPGGGFGGGLGGGMQPPL
jgi:hypothetical protein